MRACVVVVGVICMYACVCVYILENREFAIKALRHSDHGGL